MNAKALSEEALKFIGQALGTSDFEVIPLAGDASTRRYYRIVHGDASAVLMSWEPFENEDDYPFINVQRHFSKHGVQVPNILGVSPERGLVVLEDLGDLTLERKFWENQNQMESLDFYKLAVDELIKMHYPATFDRTTKCRAFAIEFDTEKLLWEMNYGKEHLFEKFCKITFSEGAEKDLTSSFTDICMKLDAQEKFICHRDYHSRNLMLWRGKMRVIDFQDARMGPIQYDLVSLVHDSYVNMNQELSQKVIDYYLTRAKEHIKKPISRDEFYEIFRYQMVQRCFKACGSFASFFNTREDRRYLKYLSPTIHKVANVLESFPQYANFLNIIKDNGLLERDYESPNT